MELKHIGDLLDLDSVMEKFDLDTEQVALQWGSEPLSEDKMGMEATINNYIYLTSRLVCTNLQFIE